MAGVPSALLVYSLSLLLGSGFCINQVEVDYMAKHLDVEYQVIDNVNQPGLKFRVTLANTGGLDVATEGWSLYFSNIRIMEPDHLLVDGGTYIKREGTVLGEHNLILYHVNGVLFRIEPTKDFNGLKTGTKIDLLLHAANWQVARTDTMPNWYIAAPGTQARIITTTSGQSLDFVGDFNKEVQYKRSSLDLYKPYSPNDRYDMYPDVKDPADSVRIIPKVVKSSFQTEKFSIATGDWVVRYEDAAAKVSAAYLAEKLNILSMVKSATNLPKTRAIDLIIDPNVGTTEECKNNKETYTVDMKAASEEVTITGREESGLFWGVQTLLSLNNHNSGNLRTGTVEDCPRFGYRGMHVDVARNFYPKETILKLLDIMSMYKLNQFHFHLTDDEGWRLEIPGLPELTEIGGRRCHDLSGDKCIMPQLGSPPSGGMPGSGFYTQEDYKEILKYANDRHIKVIPEFDMPGHAHAAINAMLARQRKDNDTTYMLIDPDDTSRYLSVQAFIDDAINPCVNTTYAFVEKVVNGILDMHRGIQDLDVFNFGGDEVPTTAWVNSSACKNLDVDFAVDRLNIKKYFVEKVSEVAKEKGLGMAAWEDGVMYDGLHNLPFNLSDLAVDTVYAYAWNNIWEWGSGSRAYRLANAGYKTVLSHGTNLYFDHPHEPDPEERGYYWATRFTNTKKTFGFMPDTVYENMDFDLNGKKITKDEICKNDDSICPPLQKTENIVGIQGQLWSETVRTSRQFEGMVYPRLLALAERAWHKASWESETDPVKREAGRQKDWEEWANLMGHKELLRLDELDVHYHILPPGAKLEGSTLKLRTEFPGLRARASLDNGATWCEHTEVEVTPGSTVLLQTNSADRSRQSRMSTMEIPVTNTNTSPGPARLSPALLLTSLLVFVGVISRRSLH